MNQFYFDGFTIEISGGLQLFFLFVTIVTLLDWATDGQAIDFLGLHDILHHQLLGYLIPIPWYFAH